jgi:hypothetical protein
MSLIWESGARREAGMVCPWCLLSAPVCEECNGCEECCKCWDDADEAEMARRHKEDNGQVA